jgi:hypothetical protein
VKVRERFWESVRVWLAGLVMTLKCSSLVVAAVCDYLPSQSVVVVNVSIANPHCKPKSSNSHSKNRLTGRITGI